MLDINSIMKIYATLEDHPINNKPVIKERRVLNLSDKMIEKGLKYIKQLKVMKIKELREAAGVSKMTADYLIMHFVREGVVKKESMVSGKNRWFKITYLGE